MHVSPAKHSYASVTDRQTDDGQSDPYALLCFAGDAKIKECLWNTTVCPWQQQSRKSYFSFKVKVKDTKSLTLVSLERASLVEHACQIWLLENSYPGEFVPRRIRTQNDWVRILWLIRTRVRIIQWIRTLYITICNICKLYLCFYFYSAILRNLTFSIIKKN